MEAPAGVSQAAGPPGAEIDFSVVGLFMKATLTVQVVMVMLILASFWCWAIIVDKILEFRRHARHLAEFEGEFWSGASLEDLFERVGPQPESPAERVFAAGMVEWNRSVVAGAGVIPGTQARVERAMSVAIARESDRLTSRLGFLASTGAVAPFVGLFGTVWGIKTSFEQIAVMQNTNLAVVAPGIAEALFATALGLLAAIPAVLAYNRLSQDADRLIGELENFSDEFATILGRQVDRARMPLREAG
ncbi:MAG: protein TolQ [Pseudomonadota bacterium]